MAFDLSLPAQFKNAGWKVKIREKETREPPHATILRRTQAWRLNLRTGEFMDASPDPKLVPPALLTYLREPRQWKRLCDEWDKKYPSNPVNAHDEGDETRTDGHDN
jgi:hypothetical protein